jgi:hypothetical protein
MNDIPIELGLAKLTSIGHTAAYVSVTQELLHKERERQALALALQCPNAAAVAINKGHPPEKKFCVAGLEQL